LKNATRKWTSLQLSVHPEAWNRPTRATNPYRIPLEKRSKQADTSPMKVEKVKYVLWAADWKRCLGFYRDLFAGEIQFESEVWSEIVIAGATIGVHGGGEGKRTWTGLSFQLDDLRQGIQALTACGGTLASEPNDTPEDPLHLSMCIDPEGNEFMMTLKRH